MKLNPPSFAFRSILTIAALVYFSALAVVAAGKWNETRATRHDLEAGLRINPGNPQLWTSHARFLLASGGGDDSDLAVRHFTQALRLNVFDAVSWDGLIDALQQSDSSDAVPAALGAWGNVEPIYPEASWRLGNYLIFSGNVSEAFDRLLAAAKADKRLWVPLFDLAWKVNPDADLILKELVPNTVDANEGYFEYLMGARKLAEAKPVWERVRLGKTNAALVWGNVYTDYLMTARMAKDAESVWREVLEDSGRSWTKPAGELLTNGDFETGVTDAGLDWRFYRQPGYQMNLDGSTAKKGSHSLRVSFDGSANTDFVGVSQYVPVEPNRNYRLQAFLKLERISSDSGPLLYVQALDGRPQDRFTKSAESLVGSLPWIQQTLEFRTGPETTWVIVVLKRFPSTQIQNNKIRGTVWLDDASLKPL